MECTSQLGGGNTSTKSMTELCGALESIITVEEQTRERRKSVCCVWSQVAGVGEMMVCGQGRFADRARIQRRYVNGSRRCPGRGRLYAGYTTSPSGRHTPAMWKLQSDLHGRQ